VVRVSWNTSSEVNRRASSKLLTTGLIESEVAKRCFSPTNSGIFLSIQHDYNYTIHEVGETALAELAGSSKLSLPRGE
jgi:secreted PhoX family phosphatase